MNYTIKSVSSSTTVHITPNWTKGDFVGSHLRIAGVRKVANSENNAIIARLKQLLVGKAIGLSSLYYVEQGPTLVATVEIEG